MRVVGLDPSLRNWGIARGEYSLDTGSLRIDGLSVVSPSLPTGKQVRQNSRDLESAAQLSTAVWEAVRGAQAIFVEVPHGSQSARAMASYGICVGILGAMRTSGIPFFEVSATEVKMISVGKKTATKQEMIDWATSTHPEAPWPKYKRAGETLISSEKAEHQADAIAAIYAGIASVPFQQALPFMRAA